MSMKVIAQPLLIAFGCCCMIGCTRTEGAWNYSFDGRLLHADGTPAAGSMVVVGRRPYNEKTPQTSVEADTSGNYHGTFSTGLAWGESRFLGIIPLGRTGEDLPPPLDEVFVCVLKQPKSEHFAIHLSPTFQTTDQSGGRHLTIPDIQLSAGGGSE